MSKPATVLLMGLTASWALFGVMTTASARDCGGCGPIPPTYHHHTVVKNLYVTHEHYKTVIEHVPRVHRIVYVTDVQPVTHVHDVYHVTIDRVPVVHDEVENRTEWLPPETVHTSVTVTRIIGCRD